MGYPQCRQVRAERGATSSNRAHRKSPSPCDFFQFHDLRGQKYGHGTSQSDSIRFVLSVICITMLRKVVMSLCRHMIVNVSYWIILQVGLNHGN